MGSGPFALGTWATYHGAQHRRKPIVPPSAAVICIYIAVFQDTVSSHLLSVPCRSLPTQWLGGPRLLRSSPPFFSYQNESFGISVPWLRSQIFMEGLIANAWALPPPLLLLSSSRWPCFSDFNSHACPLGIPVRSGSSSEVCVAVCGS